jgi:hypothetical protein
MMLMILAALHNDWRLSTGKTYLSHHSNGYRLHTDILLHFKVYNYHGMQHTSLTQLHEYYVYKYHPTSPSNTTINDATALTSFPINLAPAALDTIAIFSFSESASLILGNGTPTEPPFPRMRTEAPTRQPNQNSAAFL